MSRLSLSLLGLIVIFTFGCGSKPGTTVIEGAPARTAEQEKSYDEQMQADADAQLKATQERAAAGN